MSTEQFAEQERLAEAEGTGGAWRNWGPWLAERAWGTVREDYSASGDAWTWLSYEEAASTAYRWNEDGYAGLCDREQQLCFSLSFWNGIDSAIKERAFGLTNGEGNHGEDVKDEYWYVDATPTASWLSWQAHFPQGRYPYQELRTENARRGREVGEYKLVDTGALDERWEVSVDVAKDNPDDLLIRVQVTNIGASTATLHVLPTLWFRNTWSWDADAIPPAIGLAPGRVLSAEHDRLGIRQLVCDDPAAQPLFCDNETNRRLRYGAPGPQFPTDGINDHVTTGAATVNPDHYGTKAAYWCQLEVAPGATRELRLRLGRPEDSQDLGAEFAATMALRHTEADAFHAGLLPEESSPEHAAIVRQCVAGLVWSHCYYGYDVDNWLDGDPTQPPPPDRRGDGRNASWRHLHASDVISMPDAWEYPWFASWDLAFQAAALAQADPAAAMDQLLLLLSDRYLSPSGAIPAYEWSFSDVNPPLQAWAALAITETLPEGNERHQFLQQVLHKLLLTFGWWVNRLDPEGRNLFQGGFLGLDNVGPFDRSHQPPGIGLRSPGSTGSDRSAAMISASSCRPVRDIGRPCPKSPPTSSSAWSGFTCPARTASCRRRVSAPGRPACCGCTSTSTAIPEPGSAHPTRPAGLRACSICSRGGPRTGAAANLSRDNPRTSGRTRSTGTGSPCWSDRA